MLMIIFVVGLSLFPKNCECCGDINMCYTVEIWEPWS